MATKKVGTSTGRCDKNGDLVCVGDIVKSLSGTYFVVDRYSKFKPLNTDNPKSISMADFNFEIVQKWDEQEGVDILVDVPEAETQFEMAEEAMAAAKEDIISEMIEEVEDVKEIEDNATANTLELFSDEELAEELRRRGFTLTASKEITVTKVL